MDTDDLSEEAYQAVIINSELFHHDLTLQFGVLAGRCKNEEEYLANSLLMIEYWESDIDIALTEIFYDNPPDKNKFKSKLAELKKSIKGVQKIPFEKRKPQRW
jgi:hypothetical protein